MKKSFYYGLLSAIASGVILIIARLSQNVLTPQEGLVDIVVRQIPVNLFLLGLRTFGSGAKLIVLVALSTILVGAAGLAGMFAHWMKVRWSIPGPGRKWRLALAVGLFLWIMEMVLILPLSGRGFFGLMSQPFPAAMVMLWLISCLAYSFTFAALSFRPETTKYPISEFGLSRRTFLKKLAYSGVGLILAGAIGAALWKLISSERRNASRTAQMPPEITPNQDFYIVSKDFGAVGAVASTWKFEVTGLVDHNLSIGYDQLKGLAATTLYITLECISNDVGGQSIGNAQWKGVRLRDI